nr:hypothetical protein [Aureimonas sp. SA4125]
MRVDRVAGKARQGFLPAEIGDGLQRLALQPLHQFERDVEKVSGAAGRVEHLRLAEPVVERLDGRDRVLAATGRLLALCGRQDLCPVRPERVDDGRDDQPLDIGERRVMGAQATTLGRVERLFEERAEDGRLDLAPISLGSRQELADLLLRQTA